MDDVKKIFFHKRKYTDEDRHIAFTGDIDYSPWIGIAMTSIVKYSPYKKYVFHIFVDRIENKELYKFQKFSEKWGISISIYVLNNDKLIKMAKFNRYLVNGKYLPAFIYRFFIPELISNDIKRVLYLDGDVLCNGSINALFSMNMKNNIIAASLDLKSDVRAKELGLKEYFNSGVMLININEWKENEVTKQLVEKLHEVTSNAIELPCPDQDILNMILYGKTLFINQYYNTPYRLVQPSLIKHKIINANPMKAGLIHFIGAIKPWTNYNQVVPIVKIWAAAKADSPWLDKPLHKPESQKALHQAARDWRRRKKWIAMMKAYGCFFYSKFNGTQKNGY